MRILVTAGNTQTPIDKVRCITNIFSGRTGTRIALEARERGHEVCLLTSHPEVVQDVAKDGEPSGTSWRVRSYRTFDDLQRLMEEEITSGVFDAIIHVAAVSDYAIAGTYALSRGVSFESETQAWHSDSHPPRMADANAGKVRSNYSELWLRLIPTPKLVDQIRKPWGFRGILVKFKLEVGINEGDLARLAEASRLHSNADLIVANTLEGMNSWALIGDKLGYSQVARAQLGQRLISEVEVLSEMSNPEKKDVKYHEVRVCHRSPPPASQR